jgi:hypothetical protein
MARYTFAMMAEAILLRRAGRPVLTKPLALETLALDLTPLLLSAARGLPS